MRSKKNADQIFLIEDCRSVFNKKSCIDSSNRNFIYFLSQRDSFFRIESGIVMQVIA